MDEIIIAVKEQDVIIIEVGVQGPAGPKGDPGAGITVYETVAEMFLVIPTTPVIAYANDYPDQYWKWSFNQNTWVPF